MSAQTRPPRPAGDADAPATVIGDAPAARAPDATVLSDAADPSDATAPVQPGTLINNNYRITDLVSAGGMGEVYRAENVFTGDPVAVKVILPGLAGDPAMLDMFRREARVLVQLRDDAIVRYHNFVLDGGLQRYCLIMEYVDGRHLGARVKADGPLSDGDLSRLMRRLASGLDRAHARGVTHRDLSPDNVILREDHLDQPVLIDFGIARSTELGDGLAGRFAGKFKYIAPEQLGHWQGRIGPWTDVYGLGLLIATAARGQALQMGNSVVAASAARQAIPDLEGISHGLFPLLQHMLEPDPTQRPADMAAVLRLMDDPMALPARYRLPLWTAAQQDGADVPNDATTDSQSPFAAAPVQSASGATPSAPARRAGRAIAALVGLLVLGAGAAGWTLWPDPVVEATEPQPTATVAEMIAPDDSTRDGFLARQALPPCTFLTRVSQGPDAGRLLALSDARPDLSPVLTAYETRFGSVPALVLRGVEAAQCPMVDFLRDIAGRPVPPPVLQAQIAPEEGGFRISGAAGAGATDRVLWLALLAPDGRVYDLSQHVDRGRFALSIQSEAPPSSAGQPYLLIAMAVDSPLASVAAATAGGASSDILPRVLAELNQSAARPSVDVVRLDAAAVPRASATQD